MSTTVTPPRSPTELMTGFLRQLLDAAVTQRHCSLLAPVLLGLIHHRLRTIRERFERLAAAVAAGTWRPRAQSAAPRQIPTDRKPPQKPDSPMRRRGWLAALLPQAAAHRGQLLHMTRQPEMAALLETAPVALRRTVRQLYWMLGFKPPSILALPKRPRPPKPAEEAAAEKPQPRARPSGHREPRAHGPPGQRWWWADELYPPGFKTS
jgi:hypothetical protein